MSEQDYDRLVRLQRKLAALQKWGRHEVVEIRLCLDRTEPNVKMALDRVANLEELLGRE